MIENIFSLSGKSRKLQRFGCCTWTLEHDQYSNDRPKLMKIYILLKLIVFLTEDTSVFNSPAVALDDLRWNWIHCSVNCLMIARPKLHLRQWSSHRTWRTIWLVFTIQASLMEIKHLQVIDTDYNIQWMNIYITYTIRVNRLTAFPERQHKKPYLLLIPLEG